MSILDLFFKILRMGLGTDKDEGEPLELPSALNNSYSDWHCMYNLSVNQGVDAIMFDGLQVASNCKDDGGIPLPEKRLKMQLYARARQVEQYCELQYRLSSELAEVFSREGIRTVVLKGIAAGTCYPVPFHRPCGDLDCFLMGNYDYGNQVAESNGANVRRDYYKHSHIKYKGLEVENHQFCTAIRGSKRVKSCERLLQSILEYEGTTLIGETKLECPSPLFNALFLTYHSHHHYLSEGIALRHLCDWAMLLNVHGNEVDWTRFHQIAHEQGFDTFADTMTRLSVQHLHITLPDGYNISDNDKLDSILLNDILNYHKIHDYGNKWKARLSIVKTTFANRKRYKYFSDTTMLADLCKYIYGFCFDRHPRI